MTDLKVAAIIHPVRGSSRVAAAVCCLLLLAGCQSFTTASSVAHLRVIDLVPDATAVDIYQGGTALAYNLSYGTVTSYIPASPGTSTIRVDVAGSKQVLSEVNGTLSAGGHYTVLLNNSAIHPQQVLLTDHAAAQSVGSSSLRLIHQAGRAGSVDVYLVPAGQRLTAVTPLVSNLAPGANLGYLPIATGVYTAVILPAGTVPTSSTIAAHTGAQLEYEAGTLRSLILTDAPPTQPYSVQVIATVDAEAPN